MEVARPVALSSSSSVHLLESLKRRHYLLPASNPLWPINLLLRRSTISMSPPNMSFDCIPTESLVQDASIHTIQQDSRKRKREGSTETPPVKRPRTGRRHPWPKHWYNADGKIRCQAQGCDKVFDDERRGDQRRISHVTGTRNAEHRIISHMDRQIGCVYCDYRVVFRERRQLFNHEETAHKTCSMSTLTSFISLARRGCIIGDLGTLAAEPIFDRMLKNLYDQVPSAPRLLYYRVHRREVDTVEEVDLIKILAPHWTGPEDETLPGTKLVHPKDFLWHLRPNPLLFTEEEREWFTVWNMLREMYGKGLI